MMAERDEARPLADLDDWESAHVVARAAADASGKTTFRDYRTNVRPGVEEFYRLNHTRQTLDFRSRQELAIIFRARSEG